MTTYLSAGNLPGLLLKKGGFVHAGDVVKESDLVPTLELAQAVAVGHLLVQQPDGSFVQRKAARGCCGG